MIWSWGFNGLRLASGLLLLPLLATKLPKAEFGMYYVFLSIVALLPFLDLGFSATIGRFVGYAMAGVTELRSHGLPPATTSANPNYALLWKLLRTTRLLYFLVSALGFLVMGVWGTIIVRANVTETQDPRITWLAWGLTLVSATIELYSSWWNTFLYCLNRVQQSARISFMAYMLRLVFACTLLAFGWGLISVPAASLVGSLFTRFISSRSVLKFMSAAPPPSEAFSVMGLLRLLWPNSWRLALQVLSNYFRNNATTQICAAYFGLSATGQYGLSIQVLYVALGMAAVWTSVKWPQVMQLRAAHDFDGLKKLLWPRVWLQIITFVCLSCLAIVIGPPLLKVIGADKQLLPAPWLLILVLTSLMDLTYVFWATLLAVENRIPTLWSTVATNVITLGLVVLLIEFTSIGMLALVVVPLITGGSFLYWHWPRVGARSLGTTWTRFMFRKPVPTAPPAS